MSVSIGEVLKHEQQITDSDLIDSINLIIKVIRNVTQKEDELDAQAIVELADNALFIENAKRAQMDKPPITVALLIGAIAYYETSQ